MSQPTPQPADKSSDQSTIQTKPIKPEPDLPVIGWREWVRMPDIFVKRIKAKVDTGARSSSLHASEIERFEKNGQPYVRFQVHTSQRNPLKSVPAEAKVIDFRMVKSSSGEQSERPVIMTQVQLLGQSWDVELSLADRQEMGFRMLLGREAFRSKFIVDAGNSFYGGKPKRKKKKKAEETGG